MRTLKRSILLNVLVLFQVMPACGQIGKTAEYGASLFLNTTINRYKFPESFSLTNDFFRNDFRRAVPSFAIHFDVTIYPEERGFLKTGLRVKNARIQREVQEYVSTNPDAQSFKGTTSRYDMALPFLIGRNLSDKTSFFLGPVLTYHFYSSGVSTVFDIAENEISSNEFKGFDFSNQNFNLFAEGGVKVDVYATEKYSLFVQPTFSYSVFPLFTGNTGAAKGTYLHQAGCALGIVFN